MQHVALCTLHHSVHVLTLALMLKSVLTCGNMSHAATACFVDASGLMDIGVGAFIFSSGISSKPAPFPGPVQLYKGLSRTLQRNSLVLMLGEPCLLHITPEVMSHKLSFLQQGKVTLAISVYVYISFSLHHSH